MFKASIALVLVAFAALAYGWIAGNDTILYASIGASALAGLALLRSSMAEKRSAAERPAKPARERPEKPAKAAKSRERDISSDFPPAVDRRKAGRGRLGAEELSRQLDTEDETEFFETSEPVKPFRPLSERQPPRKAPAGAAWAKPDEVAEFQAEYDESSLEAGFEDQGYLGDAEDQADYSKQSAEAADDFRSRLAAVLGTTGEPAPAPQPPPATGRRKTRQVSPPAEDEAPPAPRRGRRKSTQPVVEPEPASQEAGEEPEPEWIRIDDVPRIRRATQPGGGFARPELPQGVTPYRPRRPGVPKAEEAEPEEAPAPTRRRAAPAQRTAAAKSKPAATKRTTASVKPAVTRVSGTGTRSRTPKEVDPDAPKPRRGRPPKPKP
ncbi:MAG TPA: hypothetical protein VHL54_13235 [Actinomycetota bacterium]|nr:hypothetical protein [Actinomycetota bacterium]